MKIDYANFLAQSQKNDHFSERSYDIDSYTIRFPSSRRTFLMSRNIFQKCISGDLSMIFETQNVQKKAKKCKKQFFWGKSVKRWSKLVQISRVTQTFHCASSGANARSLRRSAAEIWGLELHRFQHKVRQNYTEKVNLLKMCFKYLYVIQQYHIWIRHKK